MASVVSVNISEEKGTIKQPVESITLTPTGIEGDAHAGAWHRQVSLLSQESIEKFGEPSGRRFKPGEFAENITTEGLDLMQLKIHDCLEIGPVLLEVTQIGKECHGGGCAIFQEVGKCVMPKEGIFTRVIRGGTLKAGDPIEHQAKPLCVRIITLSDRASRGQYDDLSGPAIADCLHDHFLPRHWALDVSQTILPDDPEQLYETLQETEADVIFTTGGTGIGPRDITPNVVCELIDKEIPGIMEHIRVKYGANLPSALLSRSVAGVMGQNLIFTLPGSVKAVKEYMEEILKVLEHSLQMLWAIDSHGSA